MTIEIIPAGIELRFKTWENDADHYATVTLRGLSDPYARFLIDLAGHFRCTNYSETAPDGLGNEEQDEARLFSVIEQTILRHPNLTPDELQTWTDSDPYETLCENILSRPVSYDWGFCRVFESFEAFFIEQPIRISRKPITELLKKPASEEQPAPRLAPRPL